MPIYEYSCPKCGEFEVTQRITEDALKKCPTCKSKVRKLISNTSFQLKGSGWYLTDYAKKSGGSGKDSSSGESAKSSDGESKSKDKAESKSEPAKASKKDTASKAA